MGSRGQRSASASAGGNVGRTSGSFVREEAWESVSSGFSKSEVQKLKKKLTDDEIIEKLAVYDPHGMCVSQALAYIGNKSGWDVTDMKVKNQKLFSQMQVWRKRQKHVDEDGDGWFSGVKRKSEWKATQDALGTMKAGKQYFMTAGGHCSIVRLNSKTKKYEYLELQSNNGGWRAATAKEWRSRFGIRKGKRTQYGFDMSRSTYIAEIGDIATQKQFKNMLEYVNNKEY